MNKIRLLFLGFVPIFLSAQIRWEQISSLDSQIEMPNGGNRQTYSVVADFNSDGINDFAMVAKQYRKANS